MSQLINATKKFGIEYHAHDSSKALSDSHKAEKNKMETVNEYEIMAKDLIDEVFEDAVVNASGEIEHFLYDRCKEIVIEMLCDFVAKKQNQLKKDIFENLLGNFHAMRNDINEQIDSFFGNMESEIDYD